jgi:hypothetical protein
VVFRLASRPSARRPLRRRQRHVAGSHFEENGGRGIFTRPATEMKCAGAPLKHTFLIDDRCAGRATAGSRDDLCRPAGQPLRRAHRGGKVRMLFGDRGIETQISARSAIDAGRRSPPSPTADGDTEGATTTSTSSRRSARRNCPAVGPAWADKWTDQGWVEVDKPRCATALPNIFALGRCRRRAQGQDGRERQMAGAGGRGSPGRRHRRGARAPRPTTATPPAR